MANLAQALCKAIATSTSLGEVDMRNNNIGPAGGVALAALLVWMKLEKSFFRKPNFPPVQLQFTVRCQNFNDDPLRLGQAAAARHSPGGLSLNRCPETLN